MNRDSLVSAASLTVSLMTLVLVASLMARPTPEPVDLSGVGALSGQVDGLQQDLANVRADLASLNQRVGPAPSGGFNGISTIFGRLDEVQASADDARNAADSLSADVQDLTNAVDTVQARLSDLCSALNNVC